MKNVHELLSQPRLETLAVTGLAPDVLQADSLAWQGLERVLGGDPIIAWRLKSIAHGYQPETDESPEGVEFRAEFVRVPSEEE